VYLFFGIYVIYMHLFVSCGQAGFGQSRNRNMRIRLLVTLILLGLVGEIYACKCDGTGTVKGSFNGSDAVISGRVLSKEIVPYSQTVNQDSVSAIKSRLKDDKQKLSFFEMSYIVKIEFEIVEKYKGINLRDTVTIYTAMNSASCGYKFDLGKSYIIYASRKSYLDFMFMDKVDRNKGLEIKNTYWTNICTRTTEYNNLEADELRALNKE
jgi:hypothetical protein